MSLLGHVLKLIKITYEKKCENTKKSQKNKYSSEVNKRTWKLNKNNAGIPSSLKRWGVGVGWMLTSFKIVSGFVGGLGEFITPPLSPPLISFSGVKT